MRLFSFRYKDAKGNENTYDIGVKGYNVVQDSTHRFVSDKEKKAWNSKPGSSDSVKENTVEFTTAATRANIVSGETLKVMMGKIHKVISDIAAVAFSGSYTDLSNRPTIPSGAAASYAVANNDTTTATGYVADARIVRTHGLEIDQLSSELDNVNVYVGEDGKLHFVDAAGADTVLPFSRTLQIKAKVTVLDGISYIYVRIYDGDALIFDKATNSTKPTDSAKYITVGSITIE